MEVLKEKAKVTIDRRVKDFLRMDDKPANHAKCFLHGRVRVIEERAGLVDIEFVDVTLARHDWVLCQRHCAVLLYR